MEATRKSFKKCYENAKRTIFKFARKAILRYSGVTGYGEKINSNSIKCGLK